MKGKHPRFNMLIKAFNMLKNRSYFSYENAAKILMLSEW